MKNVKAKAKSFHHRYFIWIDGETFSSDSARALLENLEPEDIPFGEPTDELRLDPLVDTFADRFFPWITVLMAEPKYFFLAPAVTQAVVDSLRIQGAHTWDRTVLRKMALTELRFAEACLCCSLVDSSVKGKRIIGINKIKELDIERDLTRKDVGTNRGVAKSIQMHMTPRYLSRAAELFGMGRGQAPLEMILDRTSVVERFPFWWENHLIKDLVNSYADIILQWLNGADQASEIDLELSSSEKKILHSALFGRSDEDSYRKKILHQIDVEAVLQSRKKAAGKLASDTLKLMARSANGHIRSDLMKASEVSKCIGIIRLIYNALLAGQQKNSFVQKQFRALSKIKLPEFIDSSSYFATEALQFLWECQRAAGVSSNYLYSCIEEREARVKPGRQKLYRKNGQVTFRKNQQNQNFKPVVEEPSFRLPNVGYMLSYFAKRERK